MKIRFVCICLCAVFPATASHAADEAVFGTPESVLAVIPADVVLKRGSKWNVVGTAQANSALNAKALGKPATLKLKVESLQPTKDEKIPFLLRSDIPHVSFRGTSIPCGIWAYLGPEQADALTKVRPGNIVTISGVLTKTDFDAKPESARLILDMKECKIESQPAR